MNPRLVSCLFAAMLVGFAAAGWALHSGWHPLLALVAYSFAGSFALVVFTLAAAPRRDWRGRTRMVRLHALPEPQST